MRDNNYPVVVKTTNVSSGFHCAEANQMHSSGISCLTLQIITATACEVPVTGQVLCRVLSLGRLEWSFYSVALNYDLNDK